MLCNWTHCKQHCVLPSLDMQNSLLLEFQRQRHFHQPDIRRHTLHLIGALGDIVYGIRKIRLIFMI